MNWLMSFKRGKFVGRFKLRNSAPASETFDKAFTIPVCGCEVVWRQLGPSGDERLLRVLPVLNELMPFRQVITRVLAN